jgi:catalase
VGNNIPVFFIQDAMKFPDLIHAVKPEPHNGLPQAASAHDTFWDFVSLMPETTHTLMWVMSDRGIPRSLRMMQGFGVHTFRLVNAAGESHFVKFHWTPKLGTHSLVWDEAVKIAGADSDFHRRDLWDAIEAGEYPEWELGLQIFTEAQAEGFSFDMLDATKLIPEELVPVTPVGRMVLNRNPTISLPRPSRSPSVPHMWCPVSTSATIRCWLAVSTPISTLRSPGWAARTSTRSRSTRRWHPSTTTSATALHRQAIPRGRVAYEPNSLGSGCPFQAGAAGFVSFPQTLEGDKLRGKPEKFADHYTQATLFYESQTAVEKAHIVGGFRFELSKLTVPAIRERMLASLVNVSADMAAKIADGLGMKVPEAMPRALAKSMHPEVVTSPALSLTALPGDGGIRTRKVAILVADGVHGASVVAIQTALAAVGAVTCIIAPRLGPVKTADGESMAATGTLENSPPVLFDALVLPDGSDGVALLAGYGQTREFVANQYRHGKTILASAQPRHCSTRRMSLPLCRRANPIRVSCWSASLLRAIVRQPSLLR